MITVTGNTYNYRDRLKEWGGRWSNVEKAWCFDYLSDTKLAALRDTVGIVVVDRAPTPEPEPFYIPRAPTRLYGDDPTYFNYFADQNPSVFFGFSSLAAMVDHVERLDRPPPIAGDGVFGSDRDRDDGWKTDPKYVTFAGTSDLPEAIRIAREGWSDGLGLMDKFKIPHALSRRRIASVTGGRVNVGAMLSGNPVHMSRRVKRDHRRFVTLFVETTMWRGITPVNAMLRALIIAGMIDVLETEGYSCEIIAVASTLNRRDAEPLSQLATVIKRAGQPLNLLDVTFACGHPSFLRRFKFAMEGAAPECPDVGGIISESFNDDHAPGRNEFYIPQLMPLMQSALGSDPLDMLEFIEPEGLPIKMKERL